MVSSLSWTDPIAHVLEAHAAGTAYLCMQGLLAERKDLESEKIEVCIEMSVQIDANYVGNERARDVEHRTC